jgi:hypothetical protein
MSEISDNDAKNFSIQFFNEIDKILAKQQGGKKNKNKSYKKQKGGVGDKELDFPTPLDEQNISYLSTTKEKIKEMESEGKKGLIKIEFKDSTENKSVEEINALFAEHIKSLLDNMKDKPVLEMTPEELQVLSLFVTYKSLNPQINAASNLLTDKIENFNKLDPKVFAEDENSNENLLIIGKILEKTQGSSDLVEKQINIIQNITENAVKDIEKISSIYESNSKPHDLSSQSTSAFLNQLGYLSGLLNIIVAYQNRLKSFKIDLETKNPVIFSIMSLLYSTFAFVLFCLFKTFTFLLNSKLGKIFLLYEFIILYKNNNTVAVFIANSIIKLMKIVDRNVGVSIYVESCLNAAKDIFMEALPSLLSNASIVGLLSSSLTSALSSPEIAAKFINSLAPELSSKILEGALPTLSSATLEAIQSSTPQLIEGVTQGLMPAVTSGVSDIITQTTIDLARDMTPALIEGVSTNVMSETSIIVNQAIQNSVGNIVTEISKNAAMNSATNTAYNMLSNIAFQYATPAIASYLGLDVSQVQAITQSISQSNQRITLGGKTRKKMAKPLKKTRKNRKRKRKARRTLKK